MAEPVSVAITPEGLHECHRWIQLDELQALPGNPNLGDLESLEASLGEFGWMEGITVWRGVVLAGNHRVELARAAGETGLPGYDLSKLAETWGDARALAAAMTLNLTARAGADDPTLLKAALEAVGAASVALPPALAIPPDVEAKPVGPTTSEEVRGFVGSDTRQLILAYGVDEHAELQKIAAELAPGKSMAVLVAELLGLGP